MRDGLTVTSPSVENAVATDAAIDHLRLPEGHPDTALVDALVAAATEWAEGHCERVFVRRDFLYTAAAFPCGDTIVLPKPPLIAVDSVESYIGGTLTELDAENYHVITDRIAGMVVLANGRQWPSADTRPDAVQVAFSSGYGDTADAVPAAIKQAILLLVGHLYENRETTISGTIITSVPFGVEALLAPFRVLEIV